MAKTAAKETKKVEEKAPAPEPELVSGKESIYAMIAETVHNKTGKRIGKSGGRELFDLVVDNIFEVAVREGSFRFNGGFGSFHLREYQAGERRLPSGKTTQFGIRHKLRYEGGVCVEALIENPEGGLEEAYKARGVREPKEPAEKGKAA